MKKTIKSMLLLGLCCTGLVGFTACSDDNDDNSDEGTGDAASTKEVLFKAAATPYVQNTVLPTYTGMADAAVELAKQCETIQEKFANSTLAEADVKKAGDIWKESRRFWELSEAFLFGPAANHNIDPHIDSWPLDKNAMDDLLADIRAGKKWDIANHGGYGLLGFHSIEYVLFELSADGTQSFPHNPATYTPEVLEYLVAVANDLRDQCVLLEACWAGTENISDEKQNILAEAELEFNDNYGWMMENAGQAGSIYKTYQEVAEEIIQGCVDIATEVGNTKIGRPNQASSEEDRNYIESPYALNSIADFKDNIRSIKNSYLGSNEGDASISDYIGIVNQQLDLEVKDAIEHAIAVIDEIPEPFAKTAKSEQADIAREYVGTTLVEVLERVMTELSRQD